MKDLLLDRRVVQRFEFRHANIEAATATQVNRNVEIDHLAVERSTLLRCVSNGAAFGVGEWVVGGLLGRTGGFIVALTL